MKPKPKTECAIRAQEKTGVIIATPHSSDARHFILSECLEFGMVVELGYGEIWIYVKDGYDIEEIVTWVNDYFSNI